jgi:hypothetical protein
MTSVGFGRGFPRIWLLPVLSMTVLLGLAAFGQFSRSIVADLASWWPVWLALGGVAYYFRATKVGSIRVAGLVPLVAVGAVILFAVGHVTGWALMPSASQRLVGPFIGDTGAATLAAGIEGEIRVSPGSTEFVYVVEPVRRGGTIGIPGADEQRQGIALSVALREPADSGIFSYAGWELTLSNEVDWDLDLAGALDVDLTDQTISSLEAAGSGVIRLGSPVDIPLVSVDGQFEVVVPAGVAVRVLGGASVPAGWTLTDVGAESPSGGDGWQIRAVPGSTVKVTEG